MSSCKELSKKRIKSQDEDDPEQNLNLSGDESCLDLSWNPNEWLLPGKTRKRSHYEASLSNSPLVSPLSSFNLNLNSGSWIINDLTSEEVNGNINFICDGQRSSHFLNQTGSDSIGDKLKISTTEFDFNDINHSPTTESYLSDINLLPAIESHFKDFNDSIATKSHGNDINHSTATESHFKDVNHSTAIESHAIDTNHSPETESHLNNNNNLLPFLSNDGSLNSVSFDTKYESQLPDIKSDDADSYNREYINQIAGGKTEDANKGNAQPEREKILDSHAQSANLIDQLYEANTDLSEHTKCKKNPGHETFHGIDDLRVHHLPPEIQHEDSLTFFNCAAQLVVQISVFYTSPSRGPEDTYSQYIGTNRKRNGSGFISSVDSEILKFRCKRDACPLKQCSNHLAGRAAKFSRSFSSPEGAEKEEYNRHYYYSGICVHTNKHVIFDMSEAKRAVVKFFFNSPDETRVIYGHVAAIVGVNNSQDHVTVHVMSHDVDLFHTVNCLLKDTKSSYRQMVSSTHKSQTSHGLRHSHSWVAVIGHAHGMSKSITFGHVIKEEEDGSRVIKYYDAATCPGSSGGLVMTPSLLKLQWPGAVHSASDPDTGLNVTLDSRVQDLNNQEIGRIHEKLTRSNSESSFPSIEYTE
ncbi:hypothetical protein Btru_035021 [Bulinus truncatus]|nr:hypothetical protein Btru_035021 [Bulinus truncatus]